MSLRLTRRGATLPLTILVIAIMAVAVAISFGRLSSERRITANGQAQVDAFAVAQSGINNYLASLTGKPGASDDVTLNSVPGGTAQISLRMLRESTTTPLPAVYVIASRGKATGARRYDSRAPSAERTVATYALWTPAPLDLDAAFTSLSGIDKNGNSGALDGTITASPRENRCRPSLAQPCRTGLTPGIPARSMEIPMIRRLSWAARGRLEQPRMRLISIGLESRPALYCRRISCIRLGRPTPSLLTGR